MISYFCSVIESWMAPKQEITPIASRETVARVLNHLNNKKLVDNINESFLNIMVMKEENVTTIEKVHLIDSTKELISDGYLENPESTELGNYSFEL